MSLSSMLPLARSMPKAASMQVATGVMRPTAAQARRPLEILLN
jgi:hypothetical protein